MRVKTLKKGSFKVKNMANVIVLLEKTDAKNLHFGRAIDKFWAERMLEKLKSYIVWKNY